MGVMRDSRPATDLRGIHYPESDGRPMAESDRHRNEMMDLIAMLQARYADAADVYVSGNLLLYYEEGNPRASVAPDVFVVLGVPKRLRRIYKLWEEGAPPAVVFEITSRSTRREDLRTKRDLYARLGVAEYFLYDPEAEYLHPPLQGFRLVAGAYEPLSGDADGRLNSRTLGLDLGLVQGRVELRDSASGQRLVRPAERNAMLDDAGMALERAEAALDRAEEELAAERARADAAEEALRRLQAVRR